MKTKFHFILFLNFLLFLSTQLYSQWERVIDLSKSQIHEQISKVEKPLLLNSTSIDSFITTTMAEYHIPGLSACILKEGELVWHNAFGYADVERQIPVTDSTLFMIASISKTITGTAIMQLYERGLFLLDDNVNDYLPPDLQVVNPSYPNNPITFKMILSHVSSIIEDWDNVLEPLIVAGDSPIPLREFLKDFLVPGGTYYTDKSYGSYPPASIFNYCNTATALLGFLVEAITDTAFDKYCEKHIFAPLGMTETSWFLANLDTSHIARPYIWTSSGYKSYPHWGMPIYPCGFLRTTSLQLARFLNCFMQKGALGNIRILDNSTVALMTTAHYPNLPVPWQGSQGLIWGWNHLKGRVICGHSGGFHGASTRMYYCEEEKWGVIVLTNCDNDQSGAGVSAINMALFDYAAEIYVHAKIMATDSLNFVADYSQQDTVALTISNIGLESLIISEIQISGNHFKLAELLTFPILLDSKASVKLNLIFTASTQSTEIDSLQFISNDPYPPNKSVRLIGNTIFPAQEGVIYAVTGRLSSGVFLTIDPDSGTGHAVGPSGFSEISGVAIQPATGMIYGTIGGTSTTQLLKIDAKSGRAFEKITLPVPRLRAITFDSNDDLYLANLNTSRLYRLNPVTNDTIYVGTPQIKSLSGLAINPIDGQLWGTGAFDDEIYRIDKKTGVATLVGNTGFTNTSDIAFDAAGAMYGLSGLGRLTPPTDFIKIDPATGMGTLIGSTEYKAVYSLAIWGQVTTTNIGKLTRAPIPTQFELRQNYPNPFNPSTTIEFALPKSAFVTLKVYNLLGEKVATLIEENRAAGSHKFSWDAKGLATGVYLYRLETDSFTQTRKLILMR